MADIPSIPRVSCDNCGVTVDKVKVPHGKEFRKPGDWGSCHIEGTRSVDSYGGKDRIAMADLCPACADTSITAAASALKKARKEDES